MQDFPNYTSDIQILNIAKSASKHRIADFNINNRPLSRKNKGVIGQIVEEGIFHYPVNSRAEADFAKLGVELKVTGLKQLKNNSYVIKERLVLNIINYMKEYNISFENSSFWEKNKKLLLMFYLYEEKRNDYNFMIIDSILHSFSDEDLLIIKNDWSIIEQKINEGKADQISEADTMYLGACTKGADANSSYRIQPGSNVPAKQRAYCLKQSYLNTIINRNLINEQCKNIMSAEEIKYSTFEIAMNSKLSKFYGKSANALFNQFNISSEAKNKFALLTSAMLGIADIGKTDEFSKAGIQLKTIRIEENGTIEQHMSFPSFEYCKIIHESWDTADINNMLYTTKFMFAIFRKKQGLYYFEKIKFWNMPLIDIETYVKPIWQQTVDCISKGHIIKKVTQTKMYTHFPGSKINKVCHVRPHGLLSIRNNLDNGFPLPVKDKLTGLDRYTKYSFWLDKRYIIKQL